ncbi:MAG: TerB family tellurite resistance protein [Myxococcota bacterium]
MHWTERFVSIDGPAAAIISAGMRAVAKADGDVHENEMGLIAAFEEGLPKASLQESTGALGSPELREVYARSLVLVALADGVVSEEEERVIEQLCSAMQVDDDTLARVTIEAKQWFMQQFAGVTIFREAVEKIAAELGV